MLQVGTLPLVERGRSFELGLGVDRRAGSYRVSGNVLVSSRSADSGALEETDASLVAALDRSFARDTRRIRIFGVYNPAQESVFGRVIASFDLRDNVVLETSTGIFSGSGTDALSRLEQRDFLYARLKVFF
jgi:hypothetical protein